MQKRQLHEYGAYLVPSQDSDTTCPSGFDPSTTVPQCTAGNFTYVCVSDLISGGASSPASSQMCSSPSADEFWLSPQTCPQVAPARAALPCPGGGWFSLVESS